MEELQQENAALKNKVEEIQSANAIFLASFQSLSADRQELLRYKAAGGKKEESLKDVNDCTTCAAEVIQMTAPLLSAPAVRSHQESRSTVPSLKLQAVEPSFSFESKINSAHTPSWHKSSECQVLKDLIFNIEQKRVRRGCKFSE